MSLEGLRYPLYIKPIEWVEGKVRWLDTRLLPHEEVYYESDDYERIARAIEIMEIRGAPAIGVAAALAVAATAYRHYSEDIEKLRQALMKAIDRLRRTRPTAHNLYWALNRMEKLISKTVYRSADELRKAVTEEALRIWCEDIEANMKLGEIGAKLIEDGDTILTHCNAGALATAGFGTALGVIRAAWYSGKRIQVIATETRPALQGARLTIWELRREGIPVKLVTDNMVGYLMYKGMIDKVIVGADRILTDGHVINKIGTYMIALTARRHEIPFYVAAPTSTFDLETPLDGVVIEERDPDEVRYVMGRLLITIPDIEVFNPAFDITPPDLVSAIITEKGIVKPPYRVNIPALLLR